MHNDPHTLSHLFDTDTVTIIAISSGTYWYVRIRLVMNIVRCCSSRIPAYPRLGWVGPPLDLHWGPGQVSGGTLSGSFPPKTNCTWEFPFIRLESFSDAPRDILSFGESFPTQQDPRVGSRARKRAPTARGTMTNRVRHRALFIPNPIDGRGLSFSEGAGRSLRPCHYRQVVLGQIPLPGGPATHFIRRGGAP